MIDAGAKDQLKPPYQTTYFFPVISWAKAPMTTAPAVFAAHLTTGQSHSLMKHCCRIKPYQKPYQNLKIPTNIYKLDTSKLLYISD